MSLLCSIGFHKFKPAQKIFNHEGEFSHFEEECFRCKTIFERWYGRNTGKEYRVPKYNRHSELMENYND